MFYLFVLEGLTGLYGLCYLLHSARERKIAALVGTALLLLLLCAALCLTLLLP